MLLTDVRKRTINTFERTINCLTFDHNSSPGDIKGDIVKVRSCNTNESLGGIIEGIAKQGGWSQVVLITGKTIDYLDLLVEINILLLLLYIWCLKTHTHHTIPRLHHTISLNLGVVVSKWCSIFEFASLPSEVARPI